MIGSTGSFMSKSAQEVTINGRSFTLDADPNMPVLWALRDILGLTGTKFGCGAGLCGACTVHLEGKPIRSCLTSLQQVKGKAITTIEGLNNPQLITKWAEYNVPQCGYCQSGQLMSAAALLMQNARPTSNQIDEAMSGNICRCGTYTRIKAAMMSYSDKESQK